MNYRNSSLPWKGLTAGLASLIALSGQSYAEPYQRFETTGEYIQNHDGDTFRLQTADHGVVIVRFAGSDTPETAQAYWKVAREELKSLLIEKPVNISCYKINRDRHVCRVFTQGIDVGLEMVRLGYAWYAFQFAHEQTEQERQDYAVAEQYAKSKRLGLWVEPEPMPPWVCRDLRRHSQKCR
jgi:endonuclease YncB( thermonuclease family)